MATIFRKNLTDPTVQIFDKFYNTNTKVNSNEFDIVNSFFAGICATKEQADQFTAFLFRVSTESGIPAVDLIDEAKKFQNDSVKLNQFLIFYLNKFRPKTNLYGISSIPVPVFPVARNVVR